MLAAGRARWEGICWHSEHRIRQESPWLLCLPALLTWQYSLCPACLPASRLSGSGTVAFTAGHHFAADGHEDPAALAEAAASPLWVIVQVTKRCDFSCGFCSETLQMPVPTLDQLDTVRASLAGVRRV